MGWTGSNLQENGRSQVTVAGEKERATRQQPSPRRKGPLATCITLLTFVCYAKRKTNVPRTTKVFLLSADLRENL